MLFMLGFILATLINVILSTLKSVITVKGGRVVASVVNAIAYGFNTIVIKGISNVELWIAVVTTIVSNLIGVYIALTISNKFEKEKLWKITVTVLSDDIKNFKNNLHNEDIPFITYETSYEKYKVVDIFSQNKNESRKIKKIISNYNVKYTINANDGSL